ncbi:hypothetical protein GGI09_005199 [Coemansia sp. S100]|nr:hypothetical protein GGI09_005199 [Coemansia sp. S100]KAJ2105923.1 hypothetical protein GGI16_002146 [Coemansia sp. S142-1]
MNSSEGQALFNIPSYWPSKSAAFGVAGLYYALGIVLLLEGIISRRYRYVHLVVLISWMLGGAFTARGIFVVQAAQSDSPYIAFSVLESVAPNFISLVNSLLLISLMRGLNAGPPRRVLKVVWVFSVTTSVTFGAISAAGSIILTGDATLGQLSTGIKLVKASIAGQMANSLLFIVVASVLVAWYRESLGRRAWVFIIYVGGLLMVARNAARIVAVFYTSNTLMRDSEAAYYCLGPLFTLIVIFTWATLNLPARCYNEAKALREN